MADFREYSAAFQDHQNDLAHYGIPKSRWSPEARARYDTKHKKNPVGEMGRNAVRRAKKGPIRGSIYNQSSEKIAKMRDKQKSKSKDAQNQLSKLYDKYYYQGFTYTGPEEDYDKIVPKTKKIRRAKNAADTNAKWLDYEYNNVKKVEEKRGKAFKSATSKPSKTVGSKTVKIAKGKIGEANGKMAMNKKKKQYWGHK